jgi:hypothetical protein
MSLKKMVLGFCCVALLAAGAQAAVKLKVTNLPVPFPGVDTSGFLDPGTPGLGMAKLTLNLRTFAVTVSGRGNVPNLAFTKVTFVDQDALGIGGGLTLLQDKYVVSARGAATYSGKFQVP